MSIVADKDLNDIAMRSFMIVLSELQVSEANIGKQYELARRHSDEETIARAALALLQCEFGVRLLAMRAACYRRCLDDAEFSTKFWSEVTFS